MSSPVHRKRHWYSPKSTAHSVAVRPRLYFSALAGIGVLALLPRGWSASIREAVAWDLSATIYLVLAFRVMLTCKGDVLRVRAARQDDSRVVILVIILLAIGASFVATGGLLAEAKDAPHRTLNQGWPRPRSSWRGRSPRWSSRFTTHTNIIVRAVARRPLPKGSIFGAIETRTTGSSSISRPGLGQHHRRPMCRSAPTRDAARNHLVLLQHGRARSGHQSRRLDDLRGQVGGWGSLPTGTWRSVSSLRSG